MNVDVQFDYDDELQGNYSDSDNDVLLNVDEVNGVGITLQ